MSNIAYDEFDGSTLSWKDGGKSKDAFTGKWNRSKFVEVPGTDRVRYHVVTLTLQPNRDEAPVPAGYRFEVRNRFGRVDENHTQWFATEGEADRHTHLKLEELI